MTIAYPNVSVTMLVVDLARMLRRRFEAALADVETGLTVGEARTLFYVWRNPGQRQAALADIMFVEPMTLVGYLDSLERAGLIRRCPDPRDKRGETGGTDGRRRPAAATDRNSLAVGARDCAGKDSGKGQGAPGNAASGDEGQPDLRGTSGAPQVIAQNAIIECAAHVASGRGPGCHRTDFDGALHAGHAGARGGVRHA